GSRTKSLSNSTVNATRICESRAESGRVELAPAAALDRDCCSFFMCDNFRKFSAEAFAGSESRSVGKFGSGHTLASFQLDIFQPQRALATRYRNAKLARMDRAGRRCRPRWARYSLVPDTRARMLLENLLDCSRASPYLANLPAKARECTGPGLQATYAVVNELCAQLPVDGTVRFFQRWRKRRL